MIRERLRRIGELIILTRLRMDIKPITQLWTERVSRGLRAATETSCLFTLIAQSKVRHRPDRVEPRMRKRRPKPYPWLKTSRAEARRVIELYGHQ